MNSLAEEYVRYGLDPVESVPVHVAYDVTLWLFQDWSSVVEYRNSGRLIVQENIGGTVHVDESAPRTVYEIH
jgi:hypothetical protein